MNLPCTYSCMHIAFDSVQTNLPCCAMSHCMVRGGIWRVSCGKSKDSKGHPGVSKQPHPIEPFTSQHCHWPSSLLFDRRQDERAKGLSRASTFPSLLSVYKKGH